MARDRRGNPYERPRIIAAGVLIAAVVVLELLDATTPDEVISVPALGILMGAALGLLGLEFGAFRHRKDDEP